MDFLISLFIFFTCFSGSLILEPFCAFTRQKEGTFSSCSRQWIQCTHSAWVIFLSASTLYDTDVGWLLNTFLCMFYEYDDNSISTSEPVLCQCSQRIYTLASLSLCILLNILQPRLNYVQFLRKIHSTDLFPTVIRSIMTHDCNYCSLS